MTPNNRQEELISRFEEDIQSNQLRLNRIKDQLRNQEPISEDDNQFFEHFTNNLFANLRLILSQLNNNTNCPPSDASSSASTSTNSTTIEPISQNKRNRILDGDDPHSSKKARQIQPFLTGHPPNATPLAQQRQPPTGPNRSVSLGDIQGFRTGEERRSQQQPVCSALSTPATTPGGTTASAGRRRELATPAQKAEILAWYYAHGTNQTQTAKHFDHIYPALKLSQPLISGWLKGTPANDDPNLASGLPQSCSSTTTTPSTSATSTTSVPTTSTSTSTATTTATTATGTTATTTTNRRRQQKTKHVQVTEALEKWCQQAVSDNIDLNGDVIREKWREFARFYQIPPASWLKLSEGWLSSFKERNGLKGFKRLPNQAHRKTSKPTSLTTTTTPTTTTKTGDHVHGKPGVHLHNNSAPPLAISPPIGLPSPTHPLLPPTPSLLPSNQFLLHQHHQHHQHHPSLLHHHHHPHHQNHQNQQQQQQQHHNQQHLQHNQQQHQHNQQHNQQPHQQHNPQQRELQHPTRQLIPSLSTSPTDTSHPMVADGSGRPCSQDGPPTRPQTSSGLIATSPSPPPPPTTGSDQSEPGRLQRPATSSASNTLPSPHPNPHPHPHPHLFLHQIPPIGCLPIEPPFGHHHHQHHHQHQPQHHPPARPLIGFNPPQNFLALLVPRDLMASIAGTV
ncbi:hypothetical protein PGT21_018413 [Puccinia graminis f. sp. tritici]|uniref:HTH CENPB-type domain-containing protein n=1 Tax=Puccinia graminis f. sp. tritici TaxID=56615 RepID=A0A5B0MXY1_PUCGR|nr:hypothetical protein PGT21_018413 [Puccinia graminis f. sp. tritici]